MNIYTAQDIKSLLPTGDLIEVLKEAFSSPVNVPSRHHHTISLNDKPDATILLMPAWDEKKLGGVKVVNVNPGNSALNKPALSSTYLLFDAQTGQHLAMMDGEELTSRRTAAASALAADFLARSDARSLLIVGAGQVAYHLAYAYQAIRPIKNITIWNRNTANAEKLAKRLQLDDINISVTEDLESSVRNSDIISCATLSTQPIIRGKWLKPGQHVDLIGGFTPSMREADDEAIRISSVFIDTQTALHECGDILEPLKNRTLTESSIKADLHELCCGTHGGRQSIFEITLFKSVGTALEDLSAASLAHQIATQNGVTGTCQTY